MGSKKLILLPQALPMRTLWGAIRLSRGCFTLSDRIFPCYALPEGFAQPGQIQSDPAQHRVSLCLAGLSSQNFILADFIQASQNPARPCSALRHTLPSFNFPDSSRPHRLL